MVTRLDALGESKIIGSRFLVGGVTVVDGIFRRREKKYCFAARETLEKSVGFVPWRMVRREVIVRSRAWILWTAWLRPLTVGWVFAGIDVGSSAIVTVGLSSTTVRLK